MFHNLLSLFLSPASTGVSLSIIIVSYTSYMLVIVHVSHSFPFLLYQQESIFVERLKLMASCWG